LGLLQCQVSAKAPIEIMRTFLSSVLCLASLLLNAAPANDDFANRTLLVSSGSIAVTGANAGATHEACDPSTFGGGNARSVWWQWTAPFNGPVTISTFNSSFDTVLVLLTGDVLCSLATVASNDDYINFTSQVTFNAVGGIPYQIMVGGYNGASGAIKLAITVSGTGCTYSLSPTSKSFPYTATNGTVAVTASTGCTWSAVSNDSFLTITSGNSGSGNGTVAYTVANNTLLTSRSGTLTIANNTFTVTQGAAPGCTYVLSPTTAHISASAITNTVTMTAGTGCAWTATPNAAWLTIQSGSSGTGNGSIVYIAATNSTSNSRSGTITAAGQTHTVTQDGNVPCTFSIAPTSAPFTASGGTSNIVVSTLSGCMWTASSPATWVSFSTTNGTGNATITYTVAVNTNTVSRSAVLTVATQPFTITQAAAACNYSILPTSLAVAAGGTSSTIAVTTTTGCNWTAVANVSWITITAGTSGSGSGTVAFTVAANLNTSIRAGTITAATQTFTVNQAAAPCIYNINPTAAQFSEAGQSGTITVAAGTGCAWTAVSNSGFLTVDSGTPGTGNGTVGYSVAANVTTSSRTGTITVAGKTFTVTQDGTVPCSYSILPTGCACAATAGSSTIAVTANAGCAWSVSSSDSSWLTFTPASGTGNGTVTYTITANPSSIQRTATLTIASQVFTVVQAGIVCSFSVTPASATYTYVGGTGTASVTATTGCAWSSTSDSAWLTITAGSSGTGNGSVSYSVAATTATTNRTGRLTIAGKVLNVTQTGVPCSFTLSPTTATFGAVGGGGSTDLTANDPSCPWTASSNASWLTFSTASGTGSTTFTFTAAPTTVTTDRTGTITIGGQTLTVTQSGDVTLPVVSLTAPANGSTVSNIITLTATATDDVSVSRVDFFYDSASLIGSDTTSPYSLPFNTTNVSNAAHTFYARGFDPANNQGTSTTNSVTISNAAPGSTNQWVKRFGSTGSDLGLAVTIDASANVIVSGAYIGSVDFGGGVLTNGGFEDAFLAKYNTSGTFSWAKRFGEAGRDRINSVAVDASGNVAIGGYFSGAVDFGTGALTSAGLLDIVTGKYDSSGTAIWTKRFGSTSDDTCNAVAMDSSGNAFITGTFKGVVNFGGSNLTNSDAGDVYVAKYLSAAGAHSWSKKISGAGSEVSLGETVDSSGDLVVVGSFNVNANLGAGFVNTAGVEDIFIVKYLGTDGSFVWGHTYGSTASDKGTCVVVDSSGNFFMGGTFAGSFSLGGTNIVSSGAFTDGLIAKFDNAGVHQWSKRLGAAPGFINGIAVDSSGNVLVTGYFQNTANFDGQTMSSSLNSSDMFVSKYTTAGVHLWTKSYGGSNADIGYSIFANPGNPVVTGSFSGTASFDGVSLTSAGLSDIFLLKTLP
jgi:hypothetical protein